MQFDRADFFSYIREHIFGKLDKSQVEGIEKILDFWIERFPVGDLRFLCYALATATWETARTMQPIKEKGTLAYLKGKKYWPYIGRGLVQLTWKANYLKMSQVLKTHYGMEIDLVKEPELAESWKVALPVMFEGMMRGATSRGDFTGKSLEDYFSLKVNDPVNARRIINGTDRAKEIAEIHGHYVAALMYAISLGGSYGKIS